MGIRVTRLELNTGSSSGSNSDPGEENVPVTGSYFEPLTDEFMSDHPIDSDRFQKLLKEIPDFLILRDYDPEAAAAEERREGFGQRYWRPSDCLLEVISISKQHIFSVPRRGDQGYIGERLTDFVDWCDAR